jgi:glycosyltransferase involved in cell wall biosynthesis
MASTSLEIVKTGAPMSADERPRARVCMLAYAFYESDTRILQYATALAKRGDIVDVIALKRQDDQPEVEVLNGVNVYRIQSRMVNEKGLLTYASRILRFLLHSTLFLRRKHRAHPYDLVHVHNVPDFLVFAAAFPRLKGVPVILDIHDLLPEFYASKFKVNHSSFLFKFLTFVERCSTVFATHVIIANHLWHDRLVARSCRGDKCSVVRNHPDLDIFVEQSKQGAKKNDKFLLTYPGTLNSHQGLDVAIRAFASIADQIPDAEFHIYGEGSAKPSLVELANGLGQKRIIFHDFLPSREIARIMATTNLAIEPKRAASAFGSEALSTKIMEFMALGVPVIASKTKIHAYYYDESMIEYYEDDNEAQLAQAILRIKKDSRRRDQLVANARRYVQKNNWDARKQEYLKLVDSLIAVHPYCTAATRNVPASIAAPR